MELTAHTQFGPNQRAKTGQVARATVREALTTTIAARSPSLIALADIKLTQAQPPTWCHKVPMFTTGLAGCYEVHRGSGPCHRCLLACEEADPKIKHAEERLKTPTEVGAETVPSAAP
jgi:hypothetical protein